MKAANIPPGLHRIPGLLGSCHFLVEGDEAWMVDTGLFGEPARIRRLLARYRPVKIDEPFGEGDVIPAWGGLRVVHLPGHTEGHCGFYSERHDLLFAGDLFASYRFSTHLPPAIFNSRPEMIPGSLKKAVTLGARRVIPNHYNGFDGDLHRRRMEALARKVFG